MTDAPKTDNLVYIDNNHKLCDLDHPVFDLMGTQTRRDLLRLISCEHNYGNQLAKILDVSNPTVHRHLKKLVEDDILRVGERTAESYSGHRGGEAVLYTIDHSINLVLSIHSNLVHSHIIETERDGSIRNNFQGKPINYEVNSNSHDENITKYSELTKKSQKLNSEIVELERMLTKKLMEKNQVMGELDKLLGSSKLNFRQRIILRALACLGPQCYDDVAKILNADPIMIDHYLSNLEDKGWIRSKKKET